VVGGTGLYLRALLEGIFAGPGRESDLRRRLQKVADSKGVAFLYGMLGKKDPAAAKRIQSNDLIRIIRALEVHIATGEPISVLQQRVTPLSDFRIVRIGLKLPREVLYDRIDRRVLQMFDTGLLRETERLLVGGFSPDSKGFEALGYRHAVSVIGGELSLEEAIELTQRESRRYAKRQMTWFRKEPDVHWIPVAGEDPTAATGVLQILEKDLGNGI
jgi:tRNA dimethylallyltransferase